jgi:ATP-dependent Lon protease
LYFGKGVSEHLIVKGYSKEFGVRALKRTIEKELVNKIADVLLENPKRPLHLKANIKEEQIEITLKNNG